MKKLPTKLTALIVAAVCSTAILAAPTFAQEENSISEIKFGIRSFINFSNIADGVAFVENSSFGFGTGLSTVSLIPFYGIYFAPELSLETRSFNSEEELGFYIYKVKYEEWGIKTNFNFRFRYAPENIIYLEIGPALNFTFSNEATIAGQTVDLSDYRSSADFGLNWGIGFRIGEHHSLDYKVFRSFTNYYDGDNLSLVSLQIGYSYIF